MNKSLKTHRIIATFFLLIFFPTLFPVNFLYGSNNGPNAPEAQGFEPVTATDMVNLSSGDMSYVLPVMDVNGFPVSLSYHGGVPLDLESSWVGLGWNINTGAINRDINATPDDWKGGKSLDFIKYQKTDTQNTINLGVGIGKAAEVGVGMSWGSNKSLTGSVFASAGISDGFGASASLDTNGNYSLGVNAGTNNDGGNNFGGGIGISGNVSGGTINVGVGAGVKTSSGLTMGLGTSLSGGGISGSLGYSDTNGKGRNTTGVAGSGSLSFSSFSQSDWNISSTGWYIPIQIKLISFGFGKRKTTYSLSKSYSKSGYGILYNNSLALGYESSPDNVFSDYQDRFKYGDIYEQVLPQPEKEFVGDYDLERERLNFSFAGYDYYSVNATGITGALNPLIYDNATLFGMGYVGTRPDSNNEKQRVYYHNSKITNKAISSNNIHFYFDGQFTTNQLRNALQPINANGTSINNILSSSTTTNTRFQQGNYVQVYTNNQIANNQAQDLLIPENIPNSSRTLQNNFSPDGIGGYRITATDGKVYHFSLPVYHFEEVKRTIFKNNSENHVSDKRQYSPYATHWLLTAITGPDYFDLNGNNIADEGDYGYWVRLKHGKWSDGYVWRSPTDKTLKDYSTNIESRVGKEDFGHYQYGRKQLYYLDKIVSNSHTAYFVKDLRYDSVGSDLTYYFTNSYEVSNFPFPAQNSNTNLIYENGISYKSQLQLVLKKIVLVKNDYANLFESQIPNNNPLQLNVGNLENYVDSYNIALNSQGGFASVYTGQTVYTGITNQMHSVLHNIKINQEQNVIDVKDFENFDYSKAVKTVEFGYNYNLAVKHHNYSTNPSDLSNGSPGVVKNTTLNPNHGKLTLKSIKFLGRNNYDYMPPYQFEYDGEFTSISQAYIPYPPNAIAKREGTSWGKNYLGINPTTFQFETPIKDIRAKDEWGFFKDRPQAWTLTKIVTPTGANIQFEHEEDDYYTEAFSRRYWMDGLQFSFSNLTSTTFDITIRKNTEENLLPNFNFLDYFSTNEEFYFDLWLCVIDRDFASSTQREKVNIAAQGLLPLQVNNDNMVLRLSRQQYIQELDDVGDLFNHTFRLTSGNGSEHPPVSGPRDSCPGSGDGFTLVYKLLASKIPVDETGGGLRVKSITLKDENNNNFKTSYYYNVPGTTKLKNTGNYKSSGITSYSPVKGTKFVPYQSELPSPGVMYEYVTMVAENSTGQNLGETRYRFFVLRPVLDIFNENIELKYDDNTPMFKATVIDHNTQPMQVQVGTVTYFGTTIPIYETQYFMSTANKMKAKTINLKVNTSLIGQFRSIEEINLHGQLMSKTEKHYINGDILKGRANLQASHPDKIYKGSTKESFQSMKSIFNTNADDNNPVLVNRVLSISSKEIQPNVLVSVSNLTPINKVAEYFKGSDPMTGVFNIVEKTKADGKIIKTERVPAYTKYSQMGSKVSNVNNKNMLNQDAMSVTSVEVNSTWKTIDANITTWNDTWSYRNEENGSDTPDNTRKVWRKHKNFVWKEALDANGAYITTLTKDNSQFNWGVGTPLDSKWQKISEITRYNRYSMPLETKDINGNFAATKMADKNTKVIVSGNARYSEMYFSGAEHVKSGNLFDGEVRGANYRTNVIAHTGNYSVKANTITDKVFEVIGSSGHENYYNNIDAAYSATFRPGKYKISFWALNDGSPTKGTKLLFNGQNINVSETIDAGCWKQFNYFIDIPENVLNNSIAVICDDLNGNNYYDDFRMHPVASSLSTFVYDQNTDNLAFILNANNLAVAFKYDDAGRLIANYSESINQNMFQGGFKLVSQYKQQYRNAPQNSIVVPSTINNCLPPSNPQMAATIQNTCRSTFENEYTTLVTGGSGNFSYQYKWLLNASTEEFSDYTSGTHIQLVPYAAVYCNSNEYNKLWSLIVKITDNLTGQTIEKAYTQETSGCGFRLNNNIGDLEISNCSKKCSPDSYRFKIHLIDISTPGNFNYEYAYYDPESFDLTSGWFDVTRENGEFCPEFSAVYDSNCLSNVRDVVHLAFRVMNLSTGIYEIQYVSYYGDCCTDCLSRIIEPIESDSNYIDNGIMIYRDANGKILEVKDTKETIK